MAYPAACRFFWRAARAARYTLRRVTARREGTAMTSDTGGKDYGLIVTWIGMLAFGALAVWLMSALLA